LLFFLRNVATKNESEPNKRNGKEEKEGDVQTSRERVKIGKDREYNVRNTSTSPDRDFG
jgi:hypothetical protein